MSFHISICKTCFNESEFDNSCAVSFLVKNKSKLFESKITLIFLYHKFKKFLNAIKVFNEKLSKAKILVVLGIFKLQK